MSRRHSPCFRLAAPAGAGFSFLIALLAFVATGLGASVDFLREVEPILVKRCSECHGPDQQKGGLRLDSRAEALKGGKSGKAAIVPGKADESEFIRRVVTTDKDDVMPAKGDRLTAEQIATLRAWINEGATWVEGDAAKPWAFRGPARPAVPAVTSPKAVRNAIDAFIVSRLEHEQLRPAPEADRATLARRLHLDLTGLPPTWEEVERFVGDRSPDAYDRMVDRLLASPHYGEHMARWWLDLARYADSNGYQVDLTRSIWPYRDWVIQAFNRNEPFDQFTIEQLAGDLLPNATLEQRVATGFNRNTKINDEGGGDAEEYRTKAVKDRVATVATAWLGLTMNCAECHSHKYDPITQEEYYRFYAFFNSTTDGGNYSVDPNVSVPPPNVDRSVAYVRGRISEVRSQLAAAEQNLPAEMARWETRMAARTNVWRTLTLTNAVSTGGASYTNLADRSLLATGVNPIYDTILVEATETAGAVTAVLLEVLPDPSLPKNGPGRWNASGNFILDEFSAYTIPDGEGNRGATNLVWSRAQADWEQLYYRAEHAIDRNPKTGWAIGPRFGERHFLVAELKEPVVFERGTRLGFRFEHYHGNSHTLGRFRLSVTSESDPEVLWPLDPTVSALLAVPAAQRTPDQRKELLSRYRAVSPTLRSLNRELFALNQRESDLANLRSSTLVMQELPQPRETYVHVRGNFLSKGKVVSAGVPASLPPLPPGEPANRLTLARWLVATNNPLTARVTVNHLWERFFGTGLVKTSEDFGRQGEVPSHPELLDWLACEFMQPTAGGGATPAGPWDVKRMVRLLVTSATYRQGTAVPPGLLEKDLYNRLLARGPRFRLDAETIRDQALAVSGLLVSDLGGPSVYPVQVANLWKEIGFLRPEIGMDEWPLSAGPDLYRRAVYTFWRRVCTYPVFATFDAPSRDVCTARRPRTNTPLQALAALNEPTLVEAARVFGERIQREGGRGVDQRLTYAFRTCLSRSPTPAERTRLARFLEQQRAGFRQDPAAAAALVGQGNAPHPAGEDAIESAAWTMVANVLLNLDETLTKG